MTHFLMRQQDRELGEEVVFSRLRSHERLMFANTISQPDSQMRQPCAYLCEKWMAELEKP